MLLRHMALRFPLDSYRLPQLFTSNQKLSMSSSDVSNSQLQETDPQPSKRQKTMAINDLQEVSDDVRGMLPYLHLIHSMILLLTYCSPWIRSSDSTSTPHLRATGAPKLSPNCAQRPQRSGQDREARRRPPAGYRRSMLTSRPGNSRGVLRSPRAAGRQAEG